MVSLSRLFHKTEELDTKTAAVPTSAAPACAQTAEAKTASVELPQEFLDKFPGGMFRYKAESAGVIDRASSGLVRLFGCSDAEQFRALTGNTFKGIVHPDDWEWVSASISEQMEHGDSDYVRYRIIRADGEVRWVDDWGHLVEDASGARWFYATLMDATERVREKDEAFSSRSAQDDLLALPKGDKSKYVLQTLEYIAAHYADADINITTIARSIGISEGHLSHVFKKETSYTALGYLTLYRIHMARRLLADCRYKVYEVAGMVGYRDVAYFGSTFKKLTGLSPSEYQDRCR